MTSSNPVNASCTQTLNGCQLYTETRSGMVVYTSKPTSFSGGNNTRSIFSRNISVMSGPSGNADEKVVQVVVSWNNHGINRSLTVSEVVYNTN